MDVLGIVSEMLPVHYDCFGLVQINYRVAKNSVMFLWKGISNLHFQWIAAWIICDLKRNFATFSICSFAQGKG